MSLEDQRVEIPFDERDQLVETARWFSEAPDDMSAWRALVDAVETARPIHTDPLDSAVRTVANLREDKADPGTIAQAFQDLDARLRAAKPLEVASLVNPNPPGVEWLIDGWLLWGRAGLLAGDGGLGKSRLALRLAAGIAAAEPDWLGGISTAQGSRRRLLRIDSPANVVIATWEDDLDEFDRRLAAIGMHDATAGRIKFVDMADNGPLWAPLRSGHVSSMASLTTAGGEAAEVRRERGGQAAGHRPARRGIRRRRERERPGQGVPVQLGRVGTPHGLRGAVRRSHPKGRLPDFRQHRLAQRRPKPLEPRVPVPAEGRSL